MTTIGSTDMTIDTTTAVDKRVRTVTIIEITIGVIAMTMTDTEDDAYGLCPGQHVIGDPVFTLIVAMTVPKTAPMRCARDIVIRQIDGVSNIIYYQDLDSVGVIAIKTERPETRHYRLGTSSD